MAYGSGLTELKQVKALTRILVLCVQYMITPIASCTDGHLFFLVHSLCLTHLSGCKLYFCRKCVFNA